MSMLTSRGLDFFIRPGTTDEKVVPEVVQKHCYERKDFMFSKGDIWLDIGANIGTFSCYAMMRGAAKVTAFEPEEENYAILVENIRLNGFFDCVRTFKMAVTADGGDIILYTCKSIRNKYRHSIIPHNKWGTVQIKSMAIDTVFTNFTPTCVKMDCEGAEFEIIDRNTDFSGLSKLVFEYHFDIDRSIANFLKRVELLSKYFSKIYFGKLPNSATYDFFPASKIVFCQK